MADSFGNLYVGDTGNFRVRKVNSAGIISTAAGNGTLSFSGDGGPLPLPAQPADDNVPILWIVALAENQQSFTRHFRR